MNTNNTLYLLEMGMHDESIPSDIKNYRVRVVENVNIIYELTGLSMFFEFSTVDHKGELHCDTSYEKMTTGASGRSWMNTYRHASLEAEIRKGCYAYNKKNILKIVNEYKTGEKYTNICLIKTEAANIIKKIGGWREKDILGQGKDFHTEGDSFFEIGDTWNNEHKVVRCNKRVWAPTKNGRKLEVVDFCEVDLVTKKITG